MTKKMKRRRRERMTSFCGFSLCGGGCGGVGDYWFNSEGGGEEIPTECKISTSTKENSFSFIVCLL